MKRCILITILLTLYNFAFSQQDSTCDCPKIGLVLSGGGAKGIAHIGVLKVLDELGIKPDYITGTSMGSIVGGMYSLGYTAQEIAKIVHTSDWNKLLSDNIELNKIVMDEKEESNRYNIAFHLRDWQLKLPPGVIQGQQIVSKIKELSWALPSNSNFNSLPIPFHCMGVDLFSGETIEMKSGDLTSAIRASMAIPSIFSPEHIDSMLVVDGGVGRNFPVEEAKNMGADIIIGVYVGFVDKVNREDLFSLPNILSRTAALSSIVDSRQQTKKVDIFIQPDLKNLKFSDFNRSKVFEKYGEEAAMKKYEALQQLATRLKNCKKMVKKIKQAEKIKISKIDVEGVKNLSKDFVIDYSDIELGQCVSKEDLTKAVELIYGTLHFNRVSYTLLKDSLQEYTLTFNVSEKTRALLQLAFYYNNEYQLGFRNNLTLRNIAVPNSKTKFALNIAQNPSFCFEFNKFVEKKQRLSNFVFFNALKDRINLFESKYELGSYHRLTAGVGAGIKYSIGLNNQVKCYLERKSVRMFAHDVGDYMIIFKNFSYHQTKLWSLNFSYKLNTTDDLYFPKRGFIFSINYKRAGNITHNSNINKNNYDYYTFKQFKTDNFQSLYADFSFHKTYADIVSTSLGFTVGLHNKQTGFWDDYSIGGISKNTNNNHIPFVGFSYGEIFDSNVALVNLELDIKLFRTIYFAAQANVGFTSSELDEMLTFVEKSSFDNYTQGYCAGFKVDLPFGPLKAMIGINNMDNKMRWYLSAGFPLY